MSDELIGPVWSPRQQSLAAVARIARIRGCTLGQLLSPSRKQRVVAARNEAFFLLRRERRLSFPQIGKLFNRDHTTVLYGVGRHLDANGIADPDVEHLRRFALHKLHFNRRRYSSRSAT